VSTERLEGTDADGAPVVEATRAGYGWIAQASYVFDPPIEVVARASRIIAIGIAMFLPAVAGNWLDSRLGTGVLGMAGLVLGFVLGLTWLVQLSRRKKP
jgi:hypothetical protein